MEKHLKINKHFSLLKKTGMFALDRIDIHVTSQGLGQIICSGKL